MSVISRSDCSRARLIYLIKPSAGLQRWGRRARIATLMSLLENVYIPGRFSLQSAAVMLFEFLFENYSLEMNPWKLYSSSRQPPKKLSL